MGVNKSRDVLNGGGKNNGVIGIVGFMDFGEEVESGDVEIRDMKKEEVLGRKTMEGASILKESKKGLF
jgi:hypothetical protein